MCLCSSQTGVKALSQAMFVTVSNFTDWNYMDVPHVWQWWEPLSFQCPPLEDVFERLICSKQMHAKWCFSWDLRARCVYTGGHWVMINAIAHISSMNEDSNINIFHNVLCSFKSVFVCVFMQSWYLKQKLDSLCSHSHAEIYYNRKSRSQFYQYSEELVHIHKKRWLVEKRGWRV